MNPPPRAEAALHPEIEILPAALYARACSAADRADALIAGWMARQSLPILRVGLGIVFFWFGVLKFFPGLSPAQDLAIRTMDALSFGLVGPHVAIVVLAAWECVIGLGLILGVAMRLTLGLLFLQMMGTLTPVLLFPHELFSHLYFAPTLEGQYIIKNVVLIGGGLVLGATVRGGSVVAEPLAGQP
jgi:uncharacterized membrane protein YphA (DoxX/SURF4 family)